MIASAPLVITPQVRAELHALSQRAALAPVHMPTLMEAMKDSEGRAAHMKQMEAQAIIIPGPWPWMVVFSIETGHPCGPARHVSMSVNRLGRVPHPEAVAMVAGELGFVLPLESVAGTAGWNETLSDGMVAINIVQPMLNLHPAPHNVC